MKKEDIILLGNDISSTTVRLVKLDGFVLTGKILKTNDDTILFETLFLIC